MNESQPISEKEAINLKDSAPKERIVWIDIARGFVIVYMIITLTFDHAWFSGSLLLQFLFVHPSRVPGSMHLVDLGAPAFVMLLGILLGVTFQRRKQQDGVKKALLHIVYRYGLVVVLGIIILLASWDFKFMHERYDRFLNDGVTNINVFISDVIFVLGMVGFIALPFLFVNKKYRLLPAYGLILFYSIMLILNDYTMWINDAVSSVHLGIWFGIFGYGPITIIATTLGEYMFMEKSPSPNLYLNLGFFGVANLGLGLVLAQTSYLFIIGGLLIAIGGSILGMFLFIFVEKHFKYRLHLFEAYGKYPFLVYLAVALPWEIHKLLVDNGVLPPFGLTGLIIAITVFWVLLTGVVYLLYFKKKRVKTEWVAIATFGIVIIVVLIAWPLGWL